MQSAVELHAPVTELNLQQREQEKGKDLTMEWNRSDAMTLASAQCRACRGEGLKKLKEPRNSVCSCVLRSVFRICYRRFRECSEAQLLNSRVSLELGVRRDLPGTWGRKNEEFVADFLLISRRALSEEEHRIFRYRYLLGADWRLCSRKLGLDKGTFHHMLYRVQQKLGKAFVELQPYGLYPLRDYFSTTYRHNSGQPARRPCGGEDALRQGPLPKVA